MRTGHLAGLIALLLTACGGGNDGGGGGTSASCSTIVVCDSIPSAHVDQLCGTTTVSTVPVDDPNSHEQLDSCEYVDATNSGDNAYFARTCYGPDSDGAVTAKATFDLAKNDPPKGSDTKTPVKGIGDDAYLKDVPGSYAELFVVKGNKIFSVASPYSAPQTPDGIQAQCLVPVLNELMAL
jgi:hypothetical protein